MDSVLFFLSFYPPPLLFDDLPLICVRDWSLITGGGGGGYKMGKSQVRNFFRPPPPQDRVKLFAPPPPPFLKSGNLFAIAFHMAKTSSYQVKTTQQLFVPPPFSMATTFSAPPPFIGVKLYVTPLPPVL